MRGGPTEVNETQKWATSKKRLRTADLTHSPLTALNELDHGRSYPFKFTIH
jgi:hypothetical protein